MKYILPTIVCFLLSYSVWSQKTEKEKFRDSLKKYNVSSLKASNNNRFKETIENSNKAILYCHKLGDLSNLGAIYNRLGIAYERISELGKANKNYRIALKYAMQFDDNPQILLTYSNLGNVYSDGYKKIDSGVYFYKKAIEVNKKIKDSTNTLLPIINIGWTYIDEEMYDEAYPYLIDSKKIAYSKYGDISAKAQINFLLGRYYMAKKQYELADDAFKKAIQFAKEGKRFTFTELIETQYLHAELAGKQGNYKAAYNRLEQHLEYKDSLYKIENIKETKSAVAKFAVDDFKKDLDRIEAENRAQATILNKSKQISYALMIAGFILILLLINMFKNYKFRNRALAKLRLKNNELREAKEEAEKQANLKAQFFSTVSHELRTPLYGVVGLTSLLSEDFPNLGENENFKSLKFSSKYLLSLINNVLQINKIESQGVKLERIPFNFKSLMNEVVNSFSFAVSQNHNKIHKIIDPKIPEVLIGDSVRLSQILMNLIGNAIKFTENGNIWIQLTSVKQENKKHTIQFIIKDDGIGIPKDKQEKVFDKYIQLHPIEKNYQGTGLGLSIVKRLLILFESEIKLKSEHKKGTEFSFNITFEESKESLISDVPLPISAIDTMNKKILIVDDNKINRVVTKRVLQIKGYQCDVAKDGIEALEMLKTMEFDLILMDINMPKINGFETTKRIRKTNKITPIIALTAVEEDQIKDQIQEAGMNDFIIKPYDLAEFHQIILKNLYINVI